MENDSTLERVRVKANQQSSHSSSEDKKTLSGKKEMLQARERKSENEGRKVYARRRNKNRPRRSRRRDECESVGRSPLYGWVPGDMETRDRTSRPGHIPGCREDSLRRDKGNVTHLKAAAAAMTGRSSSARQGLEGRSPYRLGLRSDRRWGGCPGNKRTPSR